MKEQNLIILFIGKTKSGKFKKDSGDTKLDLSR